MPKVVTAEHNHEASTKAALAHPIARRLNPEAVGRVVDLLKTNAAPRFVASVMRSENGVTLPKDISNIKEIRRKKNLGGKTPIQALLEYLEN